MKGICQKPQYQRQQIQHTNSLLKDMPISSQQITKANTVGKVARKLKVESVPCVPLTIIIQQNIHVTEDKLKPTKRPNTALR